MLVFVESIVYKNTLLSFTLTTEYGKIFYGEVSYPEVSSKINDFEDEYMKNKLINYGCLEYIPHYRLGTCKTLGKMLNVWFRDLGILDFSKLVFVSRNLKDFYNFYNLILVQYANFPENPLYLDFNSFIFFKTKMKELDETSDNITTYLNKIYQSSNLEIAQSLNCEGKFDMYMGGFTKYIGTSLYESFSDYILYCII